MFTPSRPSLPPFSAAVFVAALLLMPATPSRAAAPVICHELAPADAAEGVDEAPCLAHTNGIVERKDGRLIIHAKEREVVLEGNPAACDSEDELESCRVFTLYAFNAKLGYAVIEDTAYESYSVAVIDLTTGSESSMETAPSFSPSGEQAVAVVGVNQMEPPENDIAIYDMTVSPPASRFALPYGTAAKLAGRPDDALGFEFIAWIDETHILLRIADLAAGAPDSVSLRRVDGQWQVEGPEASK